MICTFTHMQSIHAVGNEAPSWHHRWWFFLLFCRLVWMVFFCLWHKETDICLQCRLFWAQNMFPLSFGASDMSLGPGRSASRCASQNNRFLDPAVDCSLKYPEPMWSCIMQSHLRVWRSWTFNSGFCPWDFPESFHRDKPYILVTLDLKKSFELTDRSPMKLGTKCWVITHFCLETLSCRWDVIWRPCVISSPFKLFKTVLVKLFLFDYIYKTQWSWSVIFFLVQLLD